MLREASLRNAIFFVFALVFLAHPLHAANWYDETYYWVGISAIIAAAFIGLAYMVARLFELQILEAWVKIELQEVVSSVVIAVFCVALLASANAAAGFLVGDSTVGAGQYAVDAIGKIYGDGRELYLALAGAYFNVAKYASYSYTIGISLLTEMTTSYSSSPGAGLSPMVADIGMAMDGVASYLLFLSAQKSFVIFFVNSSVILLPIGVFLRSFSLTRRIGGTILGGVIAAAVIYPASFAISSGIYEAFSPDLMVKVNGISVMGSISNPPLTNTVCNPLMQTFIQSPIGLLTNSLGSLIGQGAGSAGAMVSSLGGAIFGGENGWRYTICPIVCAVVPEPCFTECWDIVGKMYVLVKAFYAISMAPALSAYAPSSGEILAAYVNLRDFALPATTMFGVLAVVFSLVPIIIAMVAGRNFMLLFGGEPQLYGISKLV